MGAPGLGKDGVHLLSVWFFIMGQGPARAGFMGPGRNTLGTHSGRVWMGICSQSSAHY